MDMDGGAKKRKSHSKKSAKKGGAGDRVVHTGPQGGKYLVSKKGGKTTKVYIKK